MKKIIFLLGFILIANFTFAQDMQMQPLPIDPKVRMGKLDNGLTYYLRHNELPKERADFYIAQRVGSMQEEENQRGLAHFLEHMCFNGTKHYPGKDLIKYLETIGVKFGENLNAYTSFDQTVYNISDVPAVRDGIIDSCLLILHDWSHDLLLDDEEIDKERGVIREEMRSRNEASLRQIEKLLPQVMPGNKYAERMPIGTEQVVMNFKHQELRDYYHKWYRPDLQGVIIVGDIDVDRVESRLKEIFADIPAPVNPAERIYYDIADNKEPLVGIVTDKESTNSVVEIDFKHKPLPREAKGTIQAFIINYFNQVASRIFRERFSDIVQKANPPFANASSYNSDFIAACTEESWSTSARVKDNDFQTALKAIARELERVDKYGFTASEYERAKSNILTSYESAFNERDKTLNAKYVNEYVSHFTEGGYIPGIEMEYNIIQGISGQIPLEMVNQYIKELISDSNIVIFAMAPEKEGVVVPKKEQLLAWFNEARAEEITPLAETVSNEPLVSDIPAGGKIVSEKHEATFDATILTLSNGVKIVVKPTVLKDDEILIGATSPGGSSLFPESDMINAQLYNSIAGTGGLGKFSKTDLSKALAGKKVQLSPSVNLTAQGFSGSSSVKDFETLLQLIYLNFTPPRMDEEAYQSTIARLKSQLENMEANPQITLQDSLIKEVYVDQNRHFRLKAGDLDKANYQTIEKWHQERFSNAGSFTFIFVGNIDLEAAKPLFAKYLGALPSTGKKETFVQVNENYRSGENKNIFDKKVENPKSTAVNVYWTTVDYSLKNSIEMDVIQNIMSIVYTEKVREDEGGTYGVSVACDFSFYPKGRAVYQAVFETDPAKVEYLNGIVHQEFRNLAENGPREADFSKSKENLLKSHQENLQQNSYWRSAILQYYRNGSDFHTDYDKILNSITPADIKKKAQALVKSGNMIEVVMNGVK
ncbi:MAG: insulinase family protein [Dysgonamonadaceae bacterium]|jgi:zinc protease|nr:insulinase family protein [Dysgonamonadaceae bacterium]